MMKVADTHLQLILRWGTNEGPNVSAIPGHLAICRSKTHVTMQGVPMVTLGYSYTITPRISVHHSDQPDVFVFIGIVKQEGGQIGKLTTGVLLLC